MHFVHVKRNSTSQTVCSSFNLKMLRSKSPTLNTCWYNCLPQIISNLKQKVIKTRKKCCTPKYCDSHNQEGVLAAVCGGRTLLLLLLLIPRTLCSNKVRERWSVNLLPFMQQHSQSSKTGFDGAMGGDRVIEPGKKN